MRTIVILSLAAMALAGCQKKEEAPAGAAFDSRTGLFATKGRYIGVGLYRPDHLWARLRPAPAPHAGAAAPGPVPASTDDDDQIIVVVDSKTGEVRQCGNLSGHCIALDPWATTSDGGGTPVMLAKNNALLAAEAQAQAEAAAAKAVDAGRRAK
ncbi:MAG: hypothetical protein JNL41_13840 [Phenylobacterium sp.]|uniref:hypothetical protein n=1 Tax=Phenylobacterium sp. TaxID=1871053 RepID=UPI001A3E78C2|nr:hypothetical protein [Phenylobacterium sp.]MBL8555354.1 hypothetical protein [Phenylobacterium sp.]